MGIPSVVFSRRHWRYATKTHPSIAQTWRSYPGLNVSQHQFRYQLNSGPYRHEDLLIVRIDHLTRPQTQQEMDHLFSPDTNNQAADIARLHRHLHRRRTCRDCPGSHNDGTERTLEVRSLHQSRIGKSLYRAIFSVLKEL